jgi:hypothetical protein
MKTTTVIESPLILRKSLSAKWEVAYYEDGKIRRGIVNAHPSWDEQRFADYYGRNFISAKRLIDEGTSKKKYKNVGSSVVHRVKAFRNKKLKSIPYGFLHSMNPTNNYSGSGTTTIAPIGGEGGGDGGGGAVGEAAYAGNIGAMEVIQFYRVAQPEQKQTLQQLMRANKLKEAWALIQEIVGVRLQGNEFDK